MKRLFSLSLAAALLTWAAWTPQAHASSHREAPAISEDPAADNTDLYAWVTPKTHDKLHIVANWNPLQEPSGGPNFHKFSDNVLYEIHIARGNNLFDIATYQIRFRSKRPKRVRPSAKNPLIGGHQFFRQLADVEQVMNVWKLSYNPRTGRETYRRLGTNIPVAPPNIGPRTFTVVYKGAYKSNSNKYDDAFAKSFIRNLNGGEGRVWAGPRDDGFYVDLGGVFDLANLRAKGKAQDGVSGFNVHSIALEIPTNKLTVDGKAPGTKPGVNTTLGIWASASRRRFTFRQWNGRQFHFGSWVQVSRLGLPLVNEALIGLQDKDRFNASHPYNDVRLFGAYFLNPVVVQDAEAVGIYKALGVDPTPFKSNRTDILNIISLKTKDRNITAIGDVLRIDIATDSGFPNGRPLIGGKQPNQEQADVTDVLLTVILAGGKLQLGDNVNYNDKNFLKEMPWLPLPHEGFSGGHGKPTP